MSVPVLKFAVQHADAHAATRAKPYISLVSPQVATQLMTTVEQLINKHGSPLGVRCQPPAAALPGGSADLLLQGCCSNRSQDSIRQAVASYRAQLADDPMQTDEEEEEPCCRPGSQRAEACAVQAPHLAQAAQQQGGRACAAATSASSCCGPATAPPAGTCGTLPVPAAAAPSTICGTQPAAACVAPADAFSRSNSSNARASNPLLADPTAAAAAAAAAGSSCSLVAQLRVALHTWEELKANARTPSTVLRWPQGPDAAAAALQDGPLGRTSPPQPCC